jgi:PAS domain S-box-containing protein
LTGDGVADADFRVLAENIPTLCWIANGDGYIVWYHRRWHDYCGSTPAEMAGWGWQSVNDPVRLPEVTARWTVAITAGDPFEMIFPLRGADGTFRRFLTRAQPVCDSDGTVLIWFRVNTEIADRVAAEAALRAGEARFGAIVDSIDQIVWSTGADGMPDFFNQRWREFTGETVGALTQGIIHPDDLARVIAAWTHSVASGEPFRLEYRMQHKDMRYRWVFGRAQCVRDDDGAIVRWYGTCTDIDEIVAARDVLTRSRSELEALVTERTAALNLSQEALAQAQKMEAIGQFTGGIVRDFQQHAVDRHRQPRSRAPPRHRRTAGASPARQLRGGSAAGGRADRAAARLLAPDAAAADGDRGQPPRRANVRTPATEARRGGPH